MVLQEAHKMQVNTTFFTVFFAVFLSFRVDRVAQTNTSVYYSSSNSVRGHRISSFQQAT